MNKQSFQFIDKEEEMLITEIEAAIERGEYSPLTGKEFDDLKQKFNKAAINTITKKMISIRINPKDIAKLKQKAKKSGVGYQTIISALVHKYVQGEIELKL